MVHYDVCRWHRRLTEQEDWSGQMSGPDQACWAAEKLIKAFSCMFLCAQQGAAHITDSLLMEQTEHTTTHTHKPVCSLLQQLTQQLHPVPTYRPPSRFLCALGLSQTQCKQKLLLDKDRTHFYLIRTFSKWSTHYMRYFVYRRNTTFLCHFKTTTFSHFFSYLVDLIYKSKLRVLC